MKPLKKNLVMASTKYSYVDNPRYSHSGIIIEDGEYKDVIYLYGKVQFIEENEHLRLKFDYQVLRNPNNVDTESENFRNIIGDILTENVEKEVNDERKNRENDIKESFI